MSKELIKRLREHAKDFFGGAGGLQSALLEAADALEAKAAPAGEREAAIEAAYAAVRDGGWDSVKDMGIQMFQAGAAHQRQQAREVVMPKRRSVDPYAYGQGANNRAEGWNACLDEFARLNGKEVV